MPLPPLKGTISGRVRRSYVLITTDASGLVAISTIEFNVSDADILWAKSEGVAASDEQQALDLTAWLMVERGRVTKKVAGKPVVLKRGSVRVPKPNVN